MTLAKGEVCVGWLHQGCYLVGVLTLGGEGIKNLAVGAPPGGEYSWWGEGISKFLAAGREVPPIPSPK